MLPASYLRRFSLQKYIGPKLFTKEGKTSCPSRVLLWNLKNGCKSVARGERFSTTTSKSEVSQSSSTAACTTPSFWAGARVQVEYTMDPPGLHDRIPALQITVIITKNDLASTC